MGFLKNYFKKASELLPGNRPSKREPKPIINLYPEIEVYIRGKKEKTIPVPILENVSQYDLERFCQRRGWKINPDGTLEPQEIKNPKKDTSFFLNINEIGKSVVTNRVASELMDAGRYHKWEHAYMAASDYVRKNYNILDMPPCFKMLQPVLLRKDFYELQCKLFFKIRKEVTYEKEEQ